MPTYCTMELNKSKLKVTRNLVSRAPLSGFMITGCHSNPYIKGLILIAKDYGIITQDSI
jgi:hypothetical protein